MILNLILTTAIEICRSSRNCGNHSRLLWTILIVVKRPNPVGKIQSYSLTRLCPEGCLYSITIWLLTEGIVIFPASRIRSGVTSLKHHYKEMYLLTKTVSQREIFEILPKERGKERGKERERKKEREKERDKRYR